MDRRSDAPELGVRPRAARHAPDPADWQTPSITPDPEPGFLKAGLEFAIAASSPSQSSAGLLVLLRQPVGERLCVTAVLVADRDDLTTGELELTSTANDGQRLLCRRDHEGDRRRVRVGNQKTVAFNLDRPAVLQVERHRLVPHREFREIDVLTFGDPLLDRPVDLGCRLRKNSFSSEHAYDLAVLTEVRSKGVQISDCARFVTEVLCVVNRRRLSENHGQSLRGRAPATTQEQSTNSGEGQ